MYSAIASNELSIVRSVWSTRGHDVTLVDLLKCYTEYRMYFTVNHFKVLNFFI